MEASKIPFKHNHSPDHLMLIVFSVAVISALLSVVQSMTSAADALPRAVK